MPPQTLFVAMIMNCISRRCDNNIITSSIILLLFFYSLLKTMNVECCLSTMGVGLHCHCILTWIQLKGEPGPGKL